MFKKGEWNPATNFDFQEKRKFTCIRRYRKENPSQVKSIKDKKKETLSQNYGDKGFKHETIIEKRKRTCMEKYGVDNVMKLKKIQSKRKDTLNKSFDGDIVFT